MIDSLRPYADTKPTGLPWLGDVPTHWNVRRIKTLLREVDSRTKTGEERLLSLRMRQGLVDHIDAGGKLIPPESLVNFKIVEPGQVVMNRMRAAAGLFGVANVRGLVSPDYAVFEPMPDAFNPYLLHAFRLPSLSAVFRAESKGLGTGESGFLRLYTDRFGPIPVPYPPLDEQRLIVRFLDWHGAQTAKMIRAKKKIIALLNEQKQAIIHRAVTRGLDPNVRLKSSGVPWVAEIPTHWQMLPNRAFLRKRKLLVGAAHNEFQLLSLTKQGVIVRDVESGKGKFSADMGTSQVVNVGDIVFCLFDIPETPRTVGLSRHEGMITGAYTVFSFSGDVDPNYIELFYIAMDDRKLLGPLYTGLRNTIAPSRFVGIKTPIPPMPEQRSIVEAVQIATAEMNTTISKIENEVSLILEYRTRLIADVVTGKLDVRAVAASLAETFEQETIDELVEDDELDEAVDDAENEEVAA